MENLQQSATDRLIRLLDQEIRSRGKGAISRADRAAGFQRGWWQNRVKAGNLSVDHLFKVLDHLGLNPSKFVRRVMRSDASFDLDRPRGVKPSLVIAAENRFEQNQEGRGVGSRWLETLDELRYQDPEHVVATAEWHLDHVELELLPQFLGVTGSAWRLMLCLDEAEHAIQAGIKIAKDRQEHAVLGNLLQRLSYVAADQGDREEALRLAEKAALIFLRIGRWEDVAKATVEQGIWLFYLDRFSESFEAHSAALKQLPKECPMYRSAAFQYLGLNSRSLGWHKEAIRYLNQAESEAEHGGICDWSKNKLNWLRAQILVDLGELDVAIELLSAIVEAFRNSHLGDAVLATCDLVRAHLLHNQPEFAYLTATSMKTLVEPLRRHKVISAAIADLLRSGQMGLTLALVETVTSRIEDERRTRAWVSLKVKDPSHFQG